MVEEYRDPLHITKKEWLEMLGNPEVFRKADLQLIKTILDNRGKMSGSEAAEKIGAKSHGVLNLQVGRLSKRIMKFLPEVEYPKNGLGMPVIGTFRSWEKTILKRTGIIGSFEKSLKMLQKLTFIRYPRRQ